MAVTRAHYGAALVLEQVARAVYDDRRSGQLFPVQWAALRYYERAGRLGRTVRGLATFLGTTRGAASRTTSSLVRRKLLAVNENPSDRRMPIFSMTDAGMEALKGDPIKQLARAISKLEGTGSEDFGELLVEIYDKLVNNRRK